eukprot:4628483-Amphidinium_carterae.1
MSQNIKCSWLVAAAINHPAHCSQPQVHQQRCCEVYGVFCFGTKLRQDGSPQAALQGGATTGCGCVCVHVGRPQTSSCPDMLTRTSACCL